jgi:2,5-furandicarboxylate decarboxylase 1
VTAVGPADVHEEHHVTARPAGAGPSLADWFANARVVPKVVEDVVEPAKFEAAAILEQLELQGAPATVFEQIRAMDGSEGRFRMLFNAYGTLDTVAAALSSSATSWPDLLEDFVERSGQLRPTVRVEQGPVQENVVEGDDVDIRMLPWTRHVAGEGGDYFTPIVVARALGGTRYNLSWNRSMFLDSRHIGVHMSPKDLWGYQRAAEAVGEALPVALVLGHHPAFNLAAASVAAADVDEYHIAGALLGESVRVMPSRSYGDDLLVPADAEVIVEGRLLPGVRAVEGPFGEYMRYVGPQKLSHVLEVDAVTWRDGATVVEIFTCHRDHLNAHMAIEASLLGKVKAAVPQVVGVSWLRGGGPTTLVISMRKTSPGQPMRAAMAAMSAQNLLKQVIVVDDDINIEDSNEVLWAVSTRMPVESNTTMLKNLPGITLDPSGSGSFDPTTGFIMDATWSLSRPHPVTGRVAESEVAKFPLSRYRIRDDR